MYYNNEAVLWFTAFLIILLIVIIIITAIVTGNYCLLEAVTCILVISFIVFFLLCALFDTREVKKVEVVCQNCTVHPPIREIKSQPKKVSKGKLIFEKY